LNGKNLYQQSKKIQEGYYSATLTAEIQTFFITGEIRKQIGIKQNIEMLYLVDELYKQYNRTINITLGKMIPWQTFDRRFTDVQWAAKMREHVYNLEKDPSAVFAY